MKENTTSKLIEDDEDEAENLLNNNNINIITTDINTNTNNIKSYTQISTNNSLPKKNRILIPTSKVVTISYRGKLPERVVDKTILFYRRRKWPKLSKLKGFMITFFFFVFFSILFTIIFSKVKNIEIVGDSSKLSYNLIMTFMWIFSISSMITLLDVASADPGRQRGTPIIKSKFDKAKISKIVGGKKYFLKYCTTCNLIRDVRTFHCNSCGLCVEKHDHHCGYVSNCIGVYNYKKFIYFLISAYFHVSLIFFTCVHFIFKFAGSMESEYGYILFFVVLMTLFGGFFEIFVFWMLIQHAQIIYTNRTTREMIKNKEYKEYNRGCKRNCNEAFCQENVKEI